MSFVEQIQKLQTLPPFRIRAVDEHGTLSEWLTINPSDLVNDLMARDIEDPNAPDMQELPVQTMYWGRMAAHAQRMWEIAQRRQRTWKARQYATILAEAEKKPTEKYIEATYRLSPEYEIVCALVDECAEACNAVQSILDAFRAKRDLFRLRRTS